MRQDNISKMNSKAKDKSRIQADFEQSNGEQDTFSIEKGKSSDRKKPVRIGGIILAILIIAGLCIGVYYLIDFMNYVNTDDAAIDGNYVNISAKMLGRIKSILVAERDTVEKGQLLILLDDADLRAQELQATASLKYAQQNLALARVNLEKTEDDFKRTKRLYNSGAATKEQFDHASKNLEIANVQYSIAKAQIDTAEAQLGVIRTQLLNTKITAPISGVIAKKSLMEGDVVQPGQTIFTINNLKNIWITANYEETKIRHIRINASVKITVDAYPSYPFKGRVSRISAAIVPPSFTIGEFTKTTQRVPIKIDFIEIPDSMVLLPGMSVEVKVKIK